MSFVFCLQLPFFAAVFLSCRSTGAAHLWTLTHLLAFSSWLHFPPMLRAMWLGRWVALTGECRALPFELFSAGEVLRHPTAPSFILSSLFFMLVLPSLSLSLVNLCFPFRSPFPPVFQMHCLPSLPSPLLRQEVIFSSCSIDSFAVNLS